jgi:UrcA family protein
MRTILLTAALLGLPLTAGADQTSISIAVAKDQLTTDAALAAVVAKIEEAAKTLCKQEIGAPLLSLGGERDCRRASVRAAISNSGIAPLSAYYASVSGDRGDETASPTLASR